MKLIIGLFQWARLACEFVKGRFLVCRSDPVVPRDSVDHSMLLYDMYHLVLTEIVLLPSILACAHTNNDI